MINQRDTLVQDLIAQLEEAKANNASLREEQDILAIEFEATRCQAWENQQAVSQLSAKLAASQDELNAEKEAKLALEAKIEKLEASLKSDRKYKDLREKISNLEMDVASLKVVIEMRNDRIKILESEKMQNQVELQNYERLRESHKKLEQKNEALTETIKLKASKNADQSREIHTLRGDLNKELTEKKKLLTKADQLEYELNQTREMLSLNVSHESAISTSNYFTPLPSRNNVSLSTSMHGDAGNSKPRSAKYLFSTPMCAELGSSFSRQHHQHQQPGDLGNHSTARQASEARFCSSPARVSSGPKVFSPIARRKAHLTYSLDNDDFPDVTTSTDKIEADSSDELRS